MGIISPVTSSDFATPIVPVIKKDGTIRVCEAYKVTLNPFLDIDTCPLPKVDDHFDVLAGGQRFSKIDLSKAYQQVKMDDDSKQYLTLNAHKELYAVNRLPFGVASARTMF